MSLAFSASEIEDVDESLLLSDPDDVSPVLESLPDDCFSCLSSASSAGIGGGDAVKEKEKSKCT